MKHRPTRYDPHKRPHRRNLRREPQAELRGAWGLEHSLTDAIRDGGIVVLEDAVRDLVDGRDHLRKSRALAPLYAAAAAAFVRSFVPRAVPSGREERRWPTEMASEDDA